MNTPAADRNLGDTLTGGSSHLALVDLAEEARPYTYDELNTLVGDVAGSMEFERGARLGVLGANSALFVATLFGIMRRGGVAVPMNTKFPDETLAYICADAALSGA